MIIVYYLCFNFVVHFTVLFILQSEAEKKLEEIKLFRTKMKEVADDARNKEELQKQLVSLLNLDT